MDNKDFASRIFLIFEDRGLQLPSINWIEALYEKSKSFSDKEINDGFTKVMNISGEDWNKKYGFGGKPAMSDWINFFNNNKKQSPENQVIIEVARILDYASFYLNNDVIFDNEFTNAAVKRYGGMSKIAWDIDKFNDNKRPREWVSRELKEIWLACYDGNHGSNEKSLGKSSFKNLDYVGDREKCLMLMNTKEEPPKNQIDQERVKDICVGLSSKFKPSY